MKKDKYTKTLDMKIIQSKLNKLSGKMRITKKKQARVINLTSFTEIYERTINY